MLLAFNQKNSSCSTVDGTKNFLAAEETITSMETNNNNSNQTDDNPASKKRKVEKQQQQQQQQPPVRSSASGLFVGGLFGQNLASLSSQHASHHADLILQQQQQLANERTMPASVSRHNHSLPTGSPSSSTAVASWPTPSTTIATSGNYNIMNQDQRLRFIESSIDLASSLYRQSDIQSILAGGGSSAGLTNSSSFSGLNGSFLPMMGSQQQGLTIPPPFAARVGLSDYSQALAVERLLQQQDRSNRLAGRNLPSLLLDRAVPVRLLPVYQQQQQQEQQLQQQYQQSMIPMGAVSSNNIQLLQQGRGVVGFSSNHSLNPGVPVFESSGTGPSSNPSTGAGSTLSPSGGSRTGGGLKRSYPDTTKDDDGSDNINDYGVTNIKIDGDLEEKLPVPDANKRVRILHFSQRKCVPLTTDEDINWYVVDC
jgi:hypothetical protein